MKKRDRTHDPKPTSGWWDEPNRHRIAAMKNNSNGGLGAGFRQVKETVSRIVPGRRPGGHILRASGRRSK